MKANGDDSPGGARPADRAAKRPAGRPFRRVPDARSVSMLGVGMVVGAVIGAGVALLAAPGSGLDTRARLRRRVKGLRRETGVWRKLSRELRRAALVKRKLLEKRTEWKRIEMAKGDAQRAALERSAEKAPSA